MTVESVAWCETLCTETDAKHSSKELLWISSGVSTQKFLKQLFSVDYFVYLVHWCNRATRASKISKKSPLTEYISNVGACLQLN